MNITKRYIDDELVEYVIDGVAQTETAAPLLRTDWPLILQPLKLLAQGNDRGAGDIIERCIGPMGGDAFKAWYEITFGRKCGCNARKEHWNNRYPLINK